jgi:hypothetical protein
MLISVCPKTRVHISAVAKVKNNFMSQMYSLT